MRYARGGRSFLNNIMRPHIEEYLAGLTQTERELYLDSVRTIDTIMEKHGMTTPTPVRRRLTTTRILLERYRADDLQSQEF